MLKTQQYHNMTTSNPKYQINYSNYPDSGTHAQPLQRGWQMTFANGCTISVQFGRGNYSDAGSTTAEVAAWMPDGAWIALQPHDDVVGWCTPDQVLEHMRHVAAIDTGTVDDWPEFGDGGDIYAI